MITLYRVDVKGFMITVVNSVIRYRVDGKRFRFRLNTFTKSPAGFETCGRLNDTRSPDHSITSCTRLAASVT